MILSHYLHPTTSSHSTRQEIHRQRQYSSIVLVRGPCAPISRVATARARARALLSSGRHRWVGGWLTVGFQWKSSPLGSHPTDCVDMVHSPTFSLSLLCLSLFKLMPTKRSNWGDGQQRCRSSATLLAGGMRMDGLITEAYAAEEEPSRSRHRASHYGAGARWGALSLFGGCKERLELSLRTTKHHPTDEVLRKNGEV